MQEHINIIQPFKIADEICAEEYDSCSPLLRSVIKTAVAFHFSVQKAPNYAEIFTEQDRSGFCGGIRLEKIPYLFMIIDKSYQSPAKFLSLLCQAVLAEIPHIFVFIHKNTEHEFFNAYINCLELCGIENSYYLPNEETLLTLQNSLDRFFNAPGKHIIFSESPDNYCNFKAPDTFRDCFPVSIAALPQQRELLRLAYGNAAKTEYTEAKLPETARTHFERLLKTPRQHFEISFLPSKPGQQNYGSGMEFCYIFSRMPQNFFCRELFFSNLETNYPKSE